MITKCPTCGRAFDVLWPQLWKYKRGKLFLCSWKCLRLYDRKEETEMARMKKDGTPAMKPGPKAKAAEAPKPVSGGPWEKMETPEGIVKGPVTPDELFEEFGKKGFKTITDVSIEPKTPTFEYKVTGIDTSVGTFQYFKSNQYLDWTDLNGETVSMNLEEWKEFMKIWPEALKVLGVEL